MKAHGVVSTLREYRRCLCSARLKGKHFNVSFIPYLLCSALMVHREGQDPWAKSSVKVSPALRWSFFQKVISCSRIAPQTNHWVCEGSWVERVGSPLIPLFFLSVWQGGKDSVCIEGGVQKCKNSLSEEQQGNNQLVTFMLLVGSVYCWTGEFHHCLLCDKGGCRWLCHTQAWERANEFQ